MQTLKYLIFGLLLANTTAICDDNFNEKKGTTYLSARMGPAFSLTEKGVISSDGKWIKDVEEDYKSGAFVSLALGYKVFEGARIEGEVSIRVFVDEWESNNLFSVGTVQMNEGTWAFMTNAYYDFFEGQTFSPYLGGGFGSMWTEEILVDSDENRVLSATMRDAHFATQGIAGLKFSPTRTFEILAEYRVIQNFMNHAFALSLSKHF